MTEKVYRGNAGMHGRADTEAIALLVSAGIGFGAGWWIGGGLLYGIAGAVGLPLSLALIVFGISYFFSR